LGIRLEFVSWGKTPSSALERNPASPQQLTSVRASERCRLGFGASGALKGTICAVKELS
jgi:hypothetical protein